MPVHFLWAVKDLIFSWPSLLTNHIDCIVEACGLKSNSSELSVAISGVFIWFVTLLWVLKAISSVDLQARLSCENVQLSPWSVVDQPTRWNKAVFLWVVNDHLVVDSKAIEAMADSTIEPLKWAKHPRCFLATSSEIKRSVFNILQWALWEVVQLVYLDHLITEQFEPVGPDILYFEVAT